MIENGLKIPVPGAFLLFEKTGKGRADRERKNHTNVSEFRKAKGFFRNLNPKRHVGKGSLDLELRCGTAFQKTHKGARSRSGIFSGKKSWWAPSLIRSDHNRKHDSIGGRLVAGDMLQQQRCRQPVKDGCIGESRQGKLQKIAVMVRGVKG